MQHAKFVTAVDKLIWTTELAWHNVKIRLIFTVTGLIQLLKFLVLIQDFTSK